MKNGGLKFCHVNNGVTVKKYSKRLFLLCIVTLTCLFGGCSSRALKHGESPTLLPDKRRIGAALKDAAFDPYIGVTAAGLIAVAASGKDKQISSYATKHTPIYGSNENARKATDIILVSSKGIALLAYTVKYFPLQELIHHGDCPIQLKFEMSPALYAPTVAAGAAFVSWGLTMGTTGLLKSAAKRERPDLSDTYSFPSMHTSSTAVANAYSARTISSMSLSPLYSYPAYAALTTLTLAVAWGRIEGEKHYPTDVLAGALIGTFFANAAYKAFLGPYQYVENFNVQIAPQGAAMTASIIF